MKNKFLPGFLSGLFLSLIACTVALTIHASSPKSDETLDNGISSSVDSSLTETSDLTTDNDAILEKISQLELLIDRFYMEDVDSDALAEGIYKGLLDSLGDPYSTYYTVEEYDALMESSSGIYCGIGATVSQNATTGIITIVKPFVTGPAYETGLLPGDIVYKVNEEEVTGQDLTEVVSKIKGEEGTEANITVIREGESDPIEFKIKRRMIEVPTIEYEMLENNIGYIYISEFDEVTAEQFRNAIDDLEKQGQEGLIVDVRDNPGGLLDTVVDMLDRLLPEGLIVYTEDKYGNREEKFSDTKDEFKKPLAVLINGNSASASEIFAGAIQDYELGTIVGTTSFGKGIVQSIIPLTDGTAIKVTVSKYFTPNGKNIHKIGIEPDLEVVLDEELKQQVVIEKSDDNQLQSAIDVIKEKIDTAR